MTFLLDSNAFSDLMRKNPRLEAQLAGLGPNDKVVICPIVRGEILYGLARPPLRRAMISHGTVAQAPASAVPPSSSTLMVQKLVRNADTVLPSPGPIVMPPL